MTRWEGEGTAESPFLVSTVDEFNDMNGVSGPYFKQTADIDFGGQPSEVKSFANNRYDGQCFTVSNLRLTVSREGVYGLFQSVVNSDIRNMVLKDVVIDIGNNQNPYFVGSLIGDANNSTMTNITLDRLTLVDNNGNSQNDFTVGGLVGKAEACYFLFCHTLPQQTQIRSFAGIVGGICGIGVDVQCYGCHNQLNLFVTNTLSKTTVGGILGISDNQCLLRACQNSGILEGRLVGGMIGFVANPEQESITCLTSCVNQGNTNGVFSGGMIGILSNPDVLFQDCLVNSNVSWTDGGGRFAFYEIISPTFANCFYNNDKTFGSSPVDSSVAAIVGLSVAQLSDGSSLFVDNLDWHYESGAVPQLIPIFGPESWRMRLLVCPSEILCSTTTLLPVGQFQNAEGTIPDSTTSSYDGSKNQFQINWGTEPGYTEIVLTIPLCSFGSSVLTIPIQLVSFMFDPDQIVPALSFPPLPVQSLACEATSAVITIPGFSSSDLTWTALASSPDIETQAVEGHPDQLLVSGITDLTAAVDIYVSNACQQEVVIHSLFIKDCCTAPPIVCEDLSPCQQKRKHRKKSKKVQSWCCI